MGVLRVIPGVCLRRNLNASISSSSKRRFSNCFQVSNEVSAALSNRKPVVALESTIITHGMPHPTNIHTAMEAESLIRASGVTPATIGVVDGILKVGLCSDEMKRLADGGASVIKTARRDLPYVLSQRLCGGTTVSATMYAAHRAGISVFATGGVGGVHRGAESSMDISSDLTELGETPVAVVSSGVKSILDIQRTLEFLETQGVCVVTLGETREFPAFYSSQSGTLSPYHLETVDEVADLIRCSLASRLGKGVLIAVPIPEQHSRGGAEVEAATVTALQEALDKGVEGKDVTPYVLSRVAELTEGTTLAANVALIKNNAEIAARIASSLATSTLNDAKIENAKRKLERNKIDTNFSNSTNIPSPSSPSSPSSTSSSSEKSITSVKRPVVVGASNIDLTSQITDSSVVYGGATNSGRLLHTVGGVGRNIADCLARIGIASVFISAVGRDNFGDMLFTSCAHMETSGIYRLSDVQTATYNQVLSSHGNVVIGIGEMDIHKSIGKDQILCHDDDIQSASLLAVDGNVPSSTLQFVIDLAYSYGVPVWYEPTDLYKAVKPFRSESWKKITYISPNIAELREIHRLLTGEGEVPETNPESADNVSTPLETVIEECKLMSSLLLEHIRCVTVTLANNGVLVAYRPNSDAEVEYVHYPAPLPVEDSEIVSVSGAGDCFVAGMISGVIQGHPVDLCVRSGLLAAHESLQSHHAVAPRISQTSFSVENLKTLPWAGNKL